ncbi:hypothetical protein LCGC14_2749180 [marine sediment metagenome]|uniref:Uncharacterized protein n=1 Tax=marine sediment metagenome TaxID=412755 RepID=A0A0F9BTW6_9ZZZZ
MRPWEKEFSKHTSDFWGTAADTAMECCNQFIHARVQIINRRVSAHWECHNCGAKASFYVGNIEPKEAEIVRAEPLNPPT